MAKIPVDTESFNILIDEIIKETSSIEKKFHLVYYSKHFFNGSQVNKCTKTNIFT